MEVQMKTLTTALAGAALLGAALAVLPAPALAQSHGGGHYSGGGYHGSGGYHGGGDRDGDHWGGYERGYGRGGYRGEYYGDRGGYYGGYGNGGYALGGLALGLALGSAFAYDTPSYDAYPGYRYETIERAPPPYAYTSPRRYACGAWRWDARADRYFWIPC
jgi:hypothetical protein